MNKKTKDEVKNENRKPNNPKRSKNHNKNKGMNILAGVLVFSSISFLLLAMLAIFVIDMT